MFHLFSSTFLIEIHQAQWRPTRLPRRSPVGLWSHKIGIVRCEKIWYFLGPGVGFANDLRFFKKRRRIPQKNPGKKQKVRKILDLLVCFYLSKLKRRPNNSLDKCGFVFSPVINCDELSSCCSLGSSNRMGPVWSVFFRRLMKSPKNNKVGGKPNEGNDGENWGPRFPLKGCMIYVLGVALCQDACHRGK